MENVRASLTETVTVRARIVATEEPY